MVWAPMPIASVNKYCDTGASEDNVSCPPKILLGSRIYAVSQALGMQEAPYGELRGRIASAVGAHRVACGGA